MLFDGTIIEREHLIKEYDYKDSYLFVYPTPEFYQNQENYNIYIYYSINKNFNLIVLKVRD